MTADPPPVAARQRQIIVGISDCAVSSVPNISLITYALGSCIGVAAFEPVLRIGGLLHIMLPESILNPEKAAQNPWMFADTGVPKMLDRLAALGADRRRIVVRLAGGAQVIEQGCIFNIGKRNYMMVKKLLWKAGIMIAGEAVGGRAARTVRLDLSNGGVYIREAGQGEVLMPGGRA